MRLAAEVAQFVRVPITKTSASTDLLELPVQILGSMGVPIEEVKMNPDAIQEAPSSLFGHPVELRARGASSASALADSPHAGSVKSLCPS